MWKAKHGTVLWVLNFDREAREAKTKACDARRPSERRAQAQAVC